MQSVAACSLATGPLSRSGPVTQPNKGSSEKMISAGRIVSSTSFAPLLRKPRPISFQVLQIALTDWSIHRRAVSALLR